MGEGVLVRDTHDYQPYYVRASNGRKWCYYQNEITTCHEVERRHRRRHEWQHYGRSSHHHRPTVGSRVCLTRFWRRHGPLRPGQEGVLVRDTHDYQPYYVRASNGRKWWYYQNEITTCHGVERHHVRHHEMQHYGGEGRRVGSGKWWSENGRDNRWNREHEREGRRLGSGKWWLENGRDNRWNREHEREGRRHGSGKWWSENGRDEPTDDSEETESEEPTEVSELSEEPEELEESEAEEPTEDS